MNKTIILSESAAFLDEYVIDCTFVLLRKREREREKDVHQ